MCIVDACITEKDRVILGWDTRELMENLIHVASPNLRRLVELRRLIKMKPTTGIYRFWLDVKTKSGRTCAYEMVIIPSCAVSHFYFRAHGVVDYHLPTIKEVCAMGGGRSDLA